MTKRKHRTRETSRVISLISDTSDCDQRA